ncbi:MAG: hypothetical protein ACK2UU_05920 [Anaerolineae bacterium]
MATPRNRALVLGLAGGLAGLLLLILVVPHLVAELVANLERVRALRGLDLLEWERSLDEAAWDAGWRSLCSPEDATTPGALPASGRALEFSALASIDRGDYATALALLQDLADSGLAGQEPNALAYQAALKMDWAAAAQAYAPQDTPRHERWWGTIFYLAAQQRMFEGELDEAANLYRQADAAYDVHGPYLGLGLVECLIRQGRSMEAWDAYRRALAVMPPEEALAHLGRFDELRLEALRAWRGQQPGNEQVAHWLAYYEGEQQGEPADPERLDAEPMPMVPVELDLGERRTLLGFDYRVEDLETGPFMAVDFYLQEGAGERAETWRMRQVVLNQAPNGAFAWDAVPDGVRPAGWHGLVYSHDLAAVIWEETTPGEGWLCLDAGQIGTSFGLQSNTASLQEQTPYIQAGIVFPVQEGSLSLGRTWFGTEEPYNYSYVGGGRQPDQAQQMVGIWEPSSGADSAAVWILVHQTGKGCFRELVLFDRPAIPALAEAEEAGR